MTTVISYEPPQKRIETYDGTTDVSGNFSVVYSFGFPAIPHVNPVIYPPGDAITRVRVTTSSATGFTVTTEKNNMATVLGVDLLGNGTTIVPFVPVRILVASS